MANYHKGSEPKFKLDIVAPGFDMNEHDFDVEITVLNKTIKGEKKGNPTDNKWGGEDVTITRVAVETDNTETTYEWYVVFTTANLPIGNITIKTTAYIPDTMAFDGVRNDIATYNFGKVID